MPLFQGQQNQGDGPVFEPEAAEGRLAKTAGRQPGRRLHL